MRLIILGMEIMNRRKNNMTDKYITFLYLELYNKLIYYDHRLNQHCNSLKEQFEKKEKKTSKCRTYNFCYCLESILCIIKIINKIILI